MAPTSDVGAVAKYSLGRAKMPVKLYAPNVGAASVTERATLVTAVPAVLVATTVNVVSGTRTEGWPEMRPVAELKFRPEGRAGEMVSVMGRVPVLVMP